MNKSTVFPSVTSCLRSFYIVKDYSIKTDFEKTYSDEFMFLNNTFPISVFLAKGSEISVKEGKKI